MNKNKKIKQIAEENNVTQHQLRNWVRNYKIKGIEALNDNRGITKKYEHYENLEEDIENYKNDALV
ncbi:MAG: helix-turn-helix domain-containing protein [Fusobacteriaceae bacterium]